MARNECGRGIDGNRKSNAGSRLVDEVIGDEAVVAADVVDEVNDESVVDDDVVEDVAV